MNAGGQFSVDSSIGCDLLLCRGSGTDGGSVVQRRAAKYRHSAGPKRNVLNVSSAGNGV